MGFLDKAKKMAEQAQTKLDEAQKQFNQPSGGPPAGGGGPVVEYDAHGRPIPSVPPPEGVTPPHGDPAAPPAQDPAASVPPPTPPAAPAPPAPPSSAGSGEQEDRNHESYAPPKLSSGDPLAG